MEAMSIAVNWIVPVHYWELNHLGETTQ